MRRRRLLFSIAAIASLSGCAGDDDTTDGADATKTSPVDDADTPENEDGEESNEETATTTTETTIEDPELPVGLLEDGVKLEQLRSAVDDVVMTGAFRSIAGVDSYEQGEVTDSTSRSVSGIKESERGRELEATAGASLYEKVDEGITPEQAAIDVLLEHSTHHSYFEDGNLYTGPDQSREFSYDDYLGHVMGYADEVFSILENLQYGSPEWDTDMGVFRVPITGIREGGEGYEIKNGEMHVTRDGLPVAVGGRSLQNDSIVDERLIVLRSDGIEIEPPEWAGAAESDD